MQTFIGDITQSGTNAPTVNLYASFPDIHLEINYLSTGQYEVLPKGLNGEPQYIFHPGYPEKIIKCKSGGYYFITYNNSLQATIYCFDVNGSPADGVMNKDYFELNV